MDDTHDDFEDLPIAYSIDNAILMHRDAHFGGSFDLMLEYYRKEGKGICKEFDIDRIKELPHTEKSAGKNLSPLCFQGQKQKRWPKPARCIKN